MCSVRHGFQRILHLDRSNTLRCPCEDQIASFQGENFADLHDQLWYLENHLLIGESAKGEAAAIGKAISSIKRREESLEQCVFCNI